MDMLDAPPPSYWQKTVPSVGLSSDIPKNADIVVVGGGIVGIATSYWLARFGLSSVLLEGSALAYGATGRNGGIIATGLAESYPKAISRLGRDTAAQILRLTLENRELVREVIVEEGIACEYREPGHITLALNAKQFEGMARSVAALQAEGIPTQLLDRQTLQESIHTTSFSGGCGRQIYAASWFSAFRKACERSCSGCTTFGHKNVYYIRAENHYRY